MPARPAARGAQPAARNAGKSAAIPQLGWHAVRPAPVVLVSGPETVLADRAARLLRDILRAEDASLEVTDLDAASYAPGELVTLASPSLFAEPRLIRVDGVEKCTDAFIEEAVAYLAAPADDCCLLLRHSGGVRGKRVLDLVRSGSVPGAIEVVCAEVKRDADRVEFVQAEFRAADRRITGGAVRALTSAFADDLAELAAACQQLISDTADEVTEQLVDRYYGGRVETSAFAVADAALAGRRGDALALLRHAIDSGADPVPIVAAFAMKLRGMAKVAGSRGSDGELARALGMAPWQVDRARRDLQGWNDEGLCAAIQALARTDHEVKGAGRDPIYALERMVGVVSARGR